MNWKEDIEPYLDSLEHAQGGFSSVRRGTIQIIDGRRVFVKIASIEQEIKWINKERAVYKWLNEQEYRYAPSLLAERDGAIALEDFSGLDWSPNWPKDKAEAAFAAMDALAKLSPKAKGLELFTSHLRKLPNGWQELLGDEQRIKAVIAMQPNLSTQKIVSYAKQTASTSQNTDTLIHEDVRSDNFAYDPVRKKGYLVDWNWTEMGCRVLDDNALLVNMRLQGLDIRKEFAGKINTEAMLWLAGFWFNFCTQPPWENNESARSARRFQKKSAIMAFELSGVQ